MSDRESLIVVILPQKKFDPRRRKTLTRERREIEASASVSGCLSKIYKTHSCVFIKYLYANNEHERLKSIDWGQDRRQQIRTDRGTGTTRPQKKLLQPAPHEKTYPHCGDIATKNPPCVNQDHQTKPLRRVPSHSIASG